MRTDYIALSIPIFFALMAIEIAATKATRRPYYRAPDAIANLSCGVLQQVGAVFYGATIMAGYEYLYEAHRLFDLSSSPYLTWILLFFGVDFLYYWFHRASHEVNFLWAAHVVHHQSEELNFAVALRQAVFQPIFSWIFYVPLAVLGFPPLIFGTTLAFSTLYQFWIHTRFIGKLGPLEWLLNTPSHHRVHHGRNPRFIDRNHGGTLIIWDRLFGTFQVEDEEIVYGITEPLRSLNPVWANFHYFRDLLEDARRARRLRDGIRLAFMRPGWKPEAATPLENRSVSLDAPKYDPLADRRTSLYALTHFIPVVLGTMHILAIQDTADMGALATLSGLVVLTCTTLGGLFEKKRWALLLEVARLVLFGAMTISAVLVGALGATAAVLMGVGLAVSISWIVRNEDGFA